MLTDLLVQFLSVTAGFHRIHHDILSCHKWQFIHQMLFNNLRINNQTIDNTADTSDMMNQLVQMSVMESMTQVTTAIQTLTDANVLTYASSLVGKEVTLGVYNDQGELEEITGVVQATGTYEGQQVIFVDDKAYTLNQIMAIGKLPEVEEPEEPEEPGEGGDTGGNEGEETPQV